MSVHDTSVTRKEGSRDAAETPLDALREALVDVREAMQRAERAVREAEREGEDPTPAPAVEAPADSWRERLWSAPAECRIGVQEVTEALGVSESWIYQRTKADAEPRLPHAKLGGSLVFRCGELRAWLRDHEEVEVAYRMEPAAGELRVQDGGGR